MMIWRCPFMTTNNNRWEDRWCGHEFWKRMLCEMAGWLAGSRPSFTVTIQKVYCSVTHIWPGGPIPFFFRLRCIVVACLLPFIVLMEELWLYCIIGWIFFYWVDRWTNALAATICGVVRGFRLIKNWNLHAKAAILRHDDISQCAEMQCADNMMMMPMMQMMQIHMYVAETDASNKEYITKNRKHRSFWWSVHRIEDSMVQVNQEYFIAAVSTSWVVTMS